MHSSALPAPCQTMLHILMQRQGIDLSNYAPKSLLRRIKLRMERLGFTDYAAYADYLTAVSDECSQLVNTILINHTAFFRDADVWATIATEIDPQLATGKPAAAPMRIWSAGCATGQEPYSLAMLLAEMLGVEQLAARVTIFATDVDADALEQVHQARYHSWSARMVPPMLLERYFARDGTHYVVREELRRAVVPKRHNLLMDAPLPQIDLLLCRNVLLYLNMAAQDRVVRRLRDALANQGVLVLGKGELAFPAQYGLQWVNRRHRVAKTAELSGMTA